MFPGFEFLIAFKNFDYWEMRSYLQKFPDRPTSREPGPHFEMRLEREGIYFHDIARSEFSAATLRSLIELALEFSEVQLEGFGAASIPEMPVRLLRDTPNDGEEITTTVE